MRPQALQPSRRRAARTIVAGAAIAVGIGHLTLLLILNANLPKVAPGPQVEPAHADFLARLERPHPAKPAPQPRRSRRPAPPPPLAAGPSASQPPPQTRAAAAPAAPVQTLPPAAPSQPSYGRWTVAPFAAPAQAPGLKLAGCTPATLPILTGAAHDACARRLTETAKSAPALPPTGYQRNVEQQAYAQAVRAWKTSPGMTPHPCPPQDEPAHKLYLDKCSLVNAARMTRSQQPALRVEFKIRF